MYLYDRYASILLLILSRPGVDFFFAAEIVRSKCLTVIGELISSKIAPELLFSLFISFRLVDYLENRKAGIASEWLPERTVSL